MPRSNTNPYFSLRDRHAQVPTRGANGVVAH